MDGSSDYVRQQRREPHNSAPGGIQTTPSAPIEEYNHPAEAPGHQSYTTTPSIETLSIQMATLTSLVETLLGTIQNNEINHQRHMTKLTTENADWRRIVSELTQKMSKDTWESFRQPVKSVLIGSSIIRDIDEDKLVNTSVICKPGGKIQNVHDVITNDLPNDEQYDTMTLVVGGNDCDTTPPTPANDIIDRYAELIDHAKTKAKSIVVSSVCPRIVKATHVKDTIEQVNAGLQVKCAEKEVAFADSASSFYLRDGDVNDGYMLQDGVHLTHRATNKLVQHLGLPVKDAKLGVCKQRHQRPKAQIQSTKIDQQRQTRHDNQADNDWTTVSHQRRQQASSKSHNQNEHTNTRRHRCHFCGEIGHNRDTCRHGKEIECRSCHRTGHKSKLCHLY